MTTRQVTLEVNGKMILDADVSKAEQKVRQFTDTVGNGAPVPGQPAAPGTTDPRHQPPPNAGQYGYNAQRSTDSAESRLGQARTPGQFRDVAEQLERALYNAQISGNKALVERIGKLNDELGKLQSAMERSRDADRQAKDDAAAAAQADREEKGRQAAADREARLQAEEAARDARRAARAGGAAGGQDDPHGGAVGGGMGGTLNHIGNFLEQQGQSSVLGGLSSRLGGPLGGLLAGPLGKLMGGPVGWVAGGLTAANYAFNAVSNSITEDNAPARNEISGNADLARQYGSSDNFMRNFRGETGWTNPRFSNLGYSATQAEHTAAIYDRPGGMMNDTTSILQFSRSMGMDESRVASAARTLGLAGVGGAKGGEAEQSLRTLKLAMSEGIKNGISGSDTLNGILNVVQRNSGSGRSTDSTALAYFAEISRRLGDPRNTNPQLRGEAGMNTMSGFMNGLGTGGGDTGIKYALVQGLIKDGLPSAKAAGMVDAQGKKTAEGLAYDNLLSETKVGAAEYLMQRAASGKNPGLMQTMTKTIDGLAGNSTYLKTKLYKQLNPEASDEQIMSLIGSGGLPEYLKNDPKALQREKTGASMTGDVQAGNRAANSTMYLRVAEADRDMLKSLTNLKLFGGLEESINNLKNGVANFKADMLSIFGDKSTNKQGGWAPGHIGDTGMTLVGTESAVPDANTGTNLPYTPQQAAAGAGTDRMLAAMAQVESTNGKDPNMNHPGQAKGAAGLFQIMGGNVTGPGSWAKQYLNIDTGAKSAEEGKAWLLAHPDEADKIGAARLKDIRHQIETQAKKDGVSLNDNVLTGMTGVLYHRNGGSSLGPLMQNGKLDGNPYHLSRNGGPDGKSDYDYYGKVSDAFGSKGLQGAAMRGGAQGAATSLTVDMVETAFKGAAKDPKVASACAQVAGQILTALGEHVTKNNNAFQFWKGLQQDGWQKADPAHPGTGSAAVFRGTQYGALNDQGTAKQPGQVGTHIMVVEGRDAKGNLVVVGNDGQRNIRWTLNADDMKAATFYMPPKKGYARGGYTGAMGRDDVAGEVHGQEFVVHADATARYRGVLEAMNSGGTGAAIGSTVTLNLGGTVNVNVALSGAAQSEIQQEFRSFQNKAGRIAAGDIQNKRGIR